MKITKNLNKIVRGADFLSVGISMVVAVVIGFVIGYYLRKWTGISFFFYFFMFVGIAAAFLNVYKIYKLQQADLKELDEKYRGYKPDFSDIDKEDD
ncbi:MAG: AtpZ/AtpI family protein [Campylobacter sp.]|nr:AtpZ/AtpI family protein [Campylobacter sp.]